MAGPPRSSQCPCWGSDDNREVAIIEQRPELVERAIEIAYATGQKATYDAFYVALAEMLGCELWTADERFWRAASPAIPFVRWLGEVVIVRPDAR